MVFMQLHGAQPQRNRNADQSDKYQLFLNEAFALSEGIRSQVVFATFVEKVENQIKSISVINASKLFLHRSGYASSKFKNNFHE